MGSGCVSSGSAVVVGSGCGVGGCVEYCGFVFVCVCVSVMFDVVWWFCCAESVVIVGSRCVLVTADDVVGTGVRCSFGVLDEEDCVTLWCILGEGEVAGVRCSLGVFDGVVCATVRC